MSAKPESHERSGGEILLDRLAGKLSHHALWDTLLLVVPPFGAALYALAMLFRGVAMNSWAIGIIAVVAVAGTMVAIIFRYRRSAPSIPEVAQLADRQSGAKDHFLTLATLPSGNYPVSFLLRLRRESSAFANRIEIKRDFPYKIKRSAYGSIGVSLLALLLIQLIAPMVRGGTRAPLVETRLHQLAEKLGAKPELKSLASQLEALAAKLADPKASVEEKQQLAQQLEQQIEEQQKREQSEENRNLLGQAAGALEGMEQQVASAQSSNQQQKGGGGIQSNLPQQGDGESKESQGAGAGKDDTKTESKSDLQQGNAGTPKSNEPTQEKNLRQGATADHNQTDPNQANKEQTGKTQGGSKEGAGKQQASEQPPPEGVHPADRLYPSGEGKQGLQGTGYVTVQLPEEIAADGKFESRPSKDAKNSRSRSQIPVSNVPLPAHVPNAASEKQELPLEYRGMIR
ncbi:MAG TPA: hypothetical protein VF452_11730 [Candidatus Binatia bacterium]